MNRLLGLPPQASEHAARLDHMTGLVHWLMLILFVVWLVFFFYVLARFRRGRQPRADYHGFKGHATNYAEGMVVVAEVVLLVAFSIPLYSERVDDVPPPEDAFEVRVVGEQFAWNVHYSGLDGTFGRTSLDLVDTESNPLGLDRSDPAAADDVTTINQLFLPVDTPVIVYLSSKDVIHSFFLPEMRVKQDAIPGMSFPVWFEPTTTSAEYAEQEGEGARFEIACAQLCGITHYSMRGYLTVLERDAFDAWMESEQEKLRSRGDAGGDDFWG